MAFLTTQATETGIRVRCPPRRRGGGMFELLGTVNRLSPSRRCRGGYALPYYRVFAPT